MLERQQRGLVAGLQEMYIRLQVAEAWQGEILPLVDGKPLVHNILTALDLIDPLHDDSGTHEPDLVEDDKEVSSRSQLENADGVQSRSSSNSYPEDSQSSHASSFSSSTPRLPAVSGTASTSGGTLDSTSTPPLSSRIAQHLQRPDPSSTSLTPYLQPYSPSSSKSSTFQTLWMNSDMHLLEPPPNSSVSMTQNPMYNQGFHDGEEAFGTVLMNDDSPFSYMSLVPPFANTSGSEIEMSSFLRA